MKFIHFYWIILAIAFALIGWWINHLPKKVPRDWSYWPVMCRMREEVREGRKCSVIQYGPKFGDEFNAREEQILWEDGK